MGVCCWLKRAATSGPPTAFQVFRFREFRGRNWLQLPLQVIKIGIVAVICAGFAIDRDLSEHGRRRGFPMLRALTILSCAAIWLMARPCAAGFVFIEETGAAFAGTTAEADSSTAGQPSNHAPPAEPPKLPAIDPASGLLPDSSGASSSSSGTVRTSNSSGSPAFAIPTATVASSNHVERVYQMERLNCPQAYLDGIFRPPRI